MSENTKRSEEGTAGTLRFKPKKPPPRSPAMTFDPRQSSCASSRSISETIAPAAPLSLPTHQQVTSTPSLPFNSTLSFLPDRFTLVVEPYGYIVASLVEHNYGLHKLKVTTAPRSNRADLGSLHRIETSQFLTRFGGTEEFIEVEQSEVDKIRNTESRGVVSRVSVKENLEKERYWIVEHQGEGLEGYTEKNIEDDIEERRQEAELEQAEDNA